MLFESINKRMVTVMMVTALIVFNALTGTWAPSPVHAQQSSEEFLGNGVILDRWVTGGEVAPGLRAMEPEIIRLIREVDPASADMLLQALQQSAPNNRDRTEAFFNAAVRLRDLEVELASASSTEYAREGGFSEIERKVFLLQTWLRGMVRGLTEDFQPPNHGEKLAEALYNWWAQREDRIWTRLPESSCDRLRHYETFRIGWSLADGRAFDDRMKELETPDPADQSLESQSTSNNQNLQNKSSGKSGNQKTGAMKQNQLDQEAWKNLTENDQHSLGQLNKLLRHLQDQVAQARDETLAQHKAKQDTWDAIQKHRKLASLIGQIEQRIAKAAEQNSSADASDGNASSEVTPVDDPTLFVLDPYDLDRPSVTGPSIGQESYGFLFLPSGNKEPFQLRCQIGERESNLTTD